LWNGAAGGQMMKIIIPGDRDIYAFTRSSGHSKICAVFNLSANPKEIDLSVKVEPAGWLNVFTNETFAYNEASRLNLKPWEYLILEKKG
jgi:hypothetical protein